MGEGLKNPHPLKIRGGIQSIPRFHPGCSTRLPLIGTITGAPGRLFPTCGSEVVSPPTVLQNPFTKWIPLWVAFRKCVSSSQLLWSKCSTKNALCQSLGRGNLKKWAIFGYHNRKKFIITFGCIIIVIMLTKCHYFTIYCVQLAQNQTYFDKELT